MMRPLEPAGGSRFPWKSLKDRIWMSIVGPLAASEVPLVAAIPVRAQAPDSDAAEQAGPQAPW